MGFQLIIAGEVDLLANYDAEAVAEVMGLAFARLCGDLRVPRGRAGPEVIEVDGAVWIVRERGHAKRSRVASPSPVFIEKAVESGLPRQALEHVAEVIGGGDKAKASALERGIVPRTTLERRQTRLSRQESERTERVARLFVQARRALGGGAEAREFMTAPHPELDGRSPFEASKTDLGARRVEQILNALEYGLAI